MTDDTLTRLDALSWSMATFEERALSRAAPGADLDVASDFGQEFTDADLAIDLVPPEQAVGWPDCNPQAIGDWQAITSAKPQLEQLKVYFAVLFEPLQPWLHGAAQRGLNALLARYPVLLHPRIQIVHSASSHRDAPRWSMSVLHMLSVARSRFPLPDDPGVGTERYQRFIDNPCVRLGLDTRAIVFSNTSRQVLGYRPIDCCLTDATGKERHWFSYSAMRLLRESGARKVDVDRAHGLLSLAAPATSVQADYGDLDTWVKQLITATGIGNGQPCPGFLEEFSRLAEAGRKGLVERPLFVNMTWRLMFDSPVPSTNVSERHDLFVDGMVTAGLAESRSAAAQLLWSRLCTKEGANIEGAVALEFVRAISRAGAALESAPGGSRLPKSERLAWALQIHQNESAMNAAIDSVASSPVAAATEKARSRRRHPI